MATLSPQMSPVSSRPERPRVQSSMSYASTRSHKSSMSKEERKLDLTETAKDKRRLEGKSDPRKALSEAQPAAVALEDSNLDDLRIFQHKDRDGNVITDPDRSNPTRPRMERPLDTIRSFNAAAEGTTSRRSSYQRPPSVVGGFDSPSKRNSQYGPPNSMYSPNGRPGPRGGPGLNQGGYYRNSSYMPRPDAFAEEGGPVQQPPRPPQHMRYQSVPYARQGDSPESMHSYHQSYDTATSGSDEMSKSTNPSSQNSSFDQLHQINQRKPEGEYYPSPPRQPSGQMRNPYPPSAMPNGYGSGYPNKPAAQTDDYGFEYGTNAPAPPPKRFAFSTSAQDPSNGDTGPSTKYYVPPEQHKRQSWIKRTFSKRS